MAPLDHEYSQIVNFFEFFAEINKNHFTFQYVIGRGGFGKVWKVELRKEKKLYAMKEMAKARIISKRSVNSVMNEKKFLC
jgi:serine/threonine protein kinase